MDSKKYKHIKLPSALQGAVTDYSPIKHGRGEDLPGFEDKPAYKQRLVSSSREVKIFADKIQDSRRVDKEKNLIDFKLKVQGRLYDKIFTKYNLKVSARYDERARGQEYSNDTIIARVSNNKLPRQVQSDFERLEADVATYINSEKDKLKSYFGLVEEFSPIVPDVIIDKKVLDLYGESESSKVVLDIVFSDDQTSMQTKLSDLRDRLGNAYLSGVNTELVHVAQVRVDKDKLSEIIYSYGGIVSVEESIKLVFQSSPSTQLQDVEIEMVAQNEVPILIADQPINTEHTLLDQACVDQVGEAFQIGGDGHGTNVASLVAYGTGLSPAGKLKIENKVASVNIVKPIPGEANAFMIDTDNITEALEKYHDPNQVLVMNISSNFNETIYERRIPHWFSVLLDEYTLKYNCLFVVSAGNLGNGWTQELRDEVFGLGFPDHFASEYSMITPPADSMNALVVGSVAYVSNPQSLSKQFEPTLITRRGLVGVKSFHLVKPDLVHYDSNWNKQFIPEDNGPYMAANDAGVIRAAGTSFAAPLVAHHLGVLIQAYPDYTLNTLKALMVHFAKEVKPVYSIDQAVTDSLVGHGIPDLDRTMYSLANSSTLIIEDSIKVNTTKAVRIPIPASIAGTASKRFKICKTLVYSPKVNNKDVVIYSPVHLTARIKKKSGKVVDSSFTQDHLNGAHKHSNVKNYKSVTLSTKKDMGEFWEIEIMAEPCDKDTAKDYIQEYSIVVSMDDLKPTGEGNIHEEIQQMIEIEVGVEIDVDV